MTFLDWLRLALVGLLLGGGLVLLLAFWIEIATRDLDNDDHH
jgi:HAMP domain-containing protein